MKYGVTYQLKKGRRVSMAIKADDEIRKEVNELFGQNQIFQDLLKEIKTKATATGKTEDSFEALENSLNELCMVLALVEGCMDRLFAELDSITGLVGKFSRSLSASKVDIEEMERQVDIVSAMLRALANRVDILCENGARDLNSQLDIVKIKRSY